MWCLVSRNQRVAVRLVKAYRPRRVRPCSNQNSLIGERLQVLQQKTPDSLALVLREHVRMPDKRHVFHRLDAHHPSESRIGPVYAPKAHTALDLTRKFRRLHVGIMPAVGGNHSSVPCRAGVNDCEDGLLLIEAATPNRML